MTTADATDDQTQSAKAASSKNTGWQPVFAVHSGGWLLRAGAIGVALAGVCALIVAPGLRGNAREETVLFWDWVAGTFSCFALVVLVALACWGAGSVARIRSAGILVRAILVVGALSAVPMAVESLHGRLQPVIAVWLAGVSIGAVFAGAFVATKAPHTRALGGILMALACAALVRVAGWEIAMWSSARGDVEWFRWSRILMTSGVCFEALGQIVAVSWLGTRGRSLGQIASMAALFGAFVLTWGVSKGGQPDGAMWQAIAHTALAGAGGIPVPVGVEGLAIFVVPAALFLAVAYAIQTGQVVAIVASIAIALVSRGAFDSPMRALCAVVAAQWATLAAVDERAMWRSLTTNRS